MRGAVRMGRQRWGFLLVGAGIVMLAGSTLAIGGDPGFVKRVPMPNFNRIRLPEPADGSAQMNALTGEVAQAIAESLDETGPGPAAVPGPRPLATESRPPPSAFIPVEFDILTPGAGSEAVGGEAIVVRKAVRMGQRTVGSLPIHVDSGSQLLVDAGDVRSLLDDAAIPATVRGSGLVSLADLRKSGIDLRYDPTSDSVLLATR